MRIYNSLTRKKEDFLPLEDGKVGMYVCGPTVYDAPHIGHARSAYIFDVIRRYLNEYKGYKVKFVRNVTDVDDKIIEKAKKRPSSQVSGANLVEATREIAKKYLDSYHEDMDLLGIQRPDEEPKATEYIEKMKKFIELLIARGAAYVADGDVYFDIKKAKEYGKLSNQNLEKMEVGARITPGEKKKDPLDFALWKKAKEGEPSWDSPWGAGRPGWHIECSVMSSEILGDEFDIHGGGIDLIFPHHENEIAQSEGASKKFARYWIHNGLLTIEGQKMAKSLGNFISIKDALKKYHPDVIKIFFLKTLYSSPIDFSEKKMYEEKSAYKKRFVFLFSTRETWKDASSSLSIADKNKIDEFKLKFEKAMDDDFNTPEALAVLFEMATYCYPLKGSITSTNDKDAAKLKYAMNMFIKLASIFGLAPDKANPLDPRLHSDTGYKKIIESGLDIGKQVAEMDRLRKEKKYARADKIRSNLEKKGIIIRNTEKGSKWDWR